MCVNIVTNRKAAQKGPTCSLQKGESITKSRKEAIINDEKDSNKSNGISPCSNVGIERMWWNIKVATKKVLKMRSKIS